MATSKTTRCNLCGLPCSAGKGRHIDHEAGLIDASVTGGYESTPGNGYGALDDASTYRFSLCEFCLDWLFSQFKVPVVVNDYTAGRSEVWCPAAERVKKDDWRTGKDVFFKEAARREKARNRAKGSK